MGKHECLLSIEIKAALSLCAQALSKSLPIAQEEPSAEGEEDAKKSSEGGASDEVKEETQSSNSETGAALAQKLQEQLAITSAWCVLSGVVLVC